jgi:hypothetical protein
LTAGPRSFVLSYAGDAPRARREFLDFTEGHFEVMQPILHNATGELRAAEVDNATDELGAPEVDGTDDSDDNDTGDDEER